MVTMYSCASCALHKGTWQRSKSSLYFTHQAVGSDLGLPLPRGRGTVFYSHKSTIQTGVVLTRGGGSRETLSAEMNRQRSDVASGLAPGEPWLWFP